MYLAAGRGSRMGGRKPCVELAPGVPLGRPALKALLRAGLGPVVAAVRPDDPGEWFPDDRGAGRFAAAICADAHEGMSRSLRAALETALRLEPELDGALVALADQPMVTGGFVGLCLEAFAREPGLQAVAGARNGLPMPPVLWSRSMFGRLMDMEGDQGGRELLREEGLRLALIELDEEAAMDVDTPADLILARRKWALRGSFAP